MLIVTSCLVCCSTTQQLEWQTLSMVRGLSDQMRAACSNVVSSAQGLPSAVQEQLAHARHSAEELYSSLGSSSSITPVLVERSRHQLTQVLSTAGFLLIVSVKAHVTYRENTITCRQCQYLTVVTNGLTPTLISNGCS